MCGRFVGRFSLDDLITEIEPHLGEMGDLGETGASVIAGNMPRFENYNVAPTQLIPVLRAGSVQRSVEVEPMQWGLVPTWAKEPSRGAPLINARSETVTEKPSFRNLVAHNRCVVPMIGFYEWDRTDPKHKIPYFVPRTDGATMWTLGLWSRPAVLDGLATVTMLTCQSTGPLARIHDRSPVHLGIDRALEWILDERAPLELVVDPHLPDVRPYRVSTSVNSIRNNGPGLLDADDSGGLEPGTTDSPRLF